MACTPASVSKWRSRTAPARTGCDVRTAGSSNSLGARSTTSSWLARWTLRPPGPSLATGPNGSRHLEPSRDDAGNIRLEGHDLGGGVAAVWGEDHREYAELCIPAGDESDHVTSDDTSQCIADPPVVARDGLGLVAATRA